VTQRFLARRRAYESGEESVWISFSDFMTALVTVFILAAVALVFSLSEEQDALAQAKAEAVAAQARGDRFDRVLDSLGNSERARASMVTEIRRSLATRGIRVEVDPTTSVLRIPVDLLGFASGSADISPRHRANALIIGRVISEVLLKGKRYRMLDTVFVEGHTDDRPISGVFGGNWGLSANRAISLWRLWEAELPTGLDSLKGRSGERLFSVSGYADTRPVTRSQVTDVDRSLNRRIDIRFTEHRLSEAEIDAIRGRKTP
jgi:flagellar motor protein MotB